MLSTTHHEIAINVPPQLSCGQDTLLHVIKMSRRPVISFQRASFVRTSAFLKLLLLTNRSPKYSCRIFFTCCWIENSRNLDYCLSKFVYKPSPSPLGQVCISYVDSHESARCVHLQVCELARRFIVLDLMRFSIPTWWRSGTVHVKLHTWCASIIWKTLSGLSAS